MLSFTTAVNYSHKYHFL